MLSTLSNRRMIEVKMDHGQTKNAKGAKKISVTEISSKAYSPPKVQDFAKAEVDKAVGKSFTGNGTPAVEPYRDVSKEKPIRRSLPSATPSPVRGSPKRTPSILSSKLSEQRLPKVRIQQKSKPKERKKNGDIQAVNLPKSLQPGYI